MKNLLLFLAVPALLLTGCSGSGADGAEAVDSVPVESTATAEAQESVEATPSAEPTEQVPANVSGPVELYCSPTNYSVNVMDGSTGTSGEIAAFYVTAQAPTFDCELGTHDSGQVLGPRYRQILSEDYLRLAVNWTDETNNSRHVGFMDSSTGELVDVTTLVTGESDFSAAGQHDNALFAPNGQFFFHDREEDTFNWFDVESQEIVQSMPVEGNGETWWIGLDGNPQSMYNMSGMNYANEISTTDPNLVIDVRTGTVVSNWFDGTRALATQDGQLGILHPQPGATNHEGSAEFTPLTPESDFSILSSIVEPSLENVFFTARRGEEIFLFTVPADGSAEPTRLRELNPGAGPLFIGYSLGK